jgi:hypothetical protein
MEFPHLPKALFVVQSYQINFYELHENLRFKIFPHNQFIAIDTVF